MGEGSWEVLSPPRQIGGMVDNSYTVGGIPFGGLGWEVYTTASAGGAAGYVLGVGAQSAEFFVRPVGDRDETRARKFKFNAAGLGSVTPGFGATYSHKSFPTVGSELQKGAAQVKDPLQLEDLQGTAHVYDFSGGSAFSRPNWKVGAGASRSFLVILFGNPSPVTLDYYKARGCIAGLSAAVGSPGGSRGVMIYGGEMTLIPGPAT